MPQIDFVTFTSQIFWLLFIFVSIYLVLVVFVLPFFAIMFKMVEKLGYLRICFSVLARAFNVNVVRANGFTLVQDLLVSLLLVLSSFMVDFTPKVTVTGAVQLILGSVLSLLVMAGLFQTLENTLNGDSSSNKN